MFEVRGKGRRGVRQRNERKIDYDKPEKKGERKRRCKK